VGTREDGNPGQGDDIGNGLPGVKQREVVLPDKEVDLGARREGLAKGGQGKYRVRGIRPGDLNIGDLEAGDRRGGQLAHAKPVAGRGRVMLRAVHGRRRRDEEKAVEFQVVKRVLGRNEVAEVDWIEGAA